MGNGGPQADERPTLRSQERPAVEIGAPIAVTVTRLATSEGGQDLVEYGLLVVFIAVIVAVGVAVLGRQLTQAWGALQAFLAGL